MPTPNHMNIYLDDNRPAPPNWCLIKSGNDLVTFYEEQVTTNNVIVSKLSLDNDMPNNSLDGDQALKIITEIAIANQIKIATKTIDVHSTNFVARQRMLNYLHAIQMHTNCLPAKILES